MLFNFEGLGKDSRRRCGGVAQLGEHLFCKQGVIGSIPFISTTPAAGKSRGSFLEEKAYTTRTEPAGRREWA